MGALGNLANALMDSTNAVTNVYDDYLTKQATLSTQTKNIQLQNDINGQLARLRQSSPDDYEQWNTDINTFFEQVKAGMSNKDSPYYCKNNLQAEQFTKILDQNQVNVSDQVNRMVQQQEVQKSRIDVNKGLLGLQEAGLAGQEYYDEAKKLVDSAYAIGAYSQEEYEQMLDTNFLTGYSAMYQNMFDDTVYAAIERGDSWEKIKGMMQEQAPAMMKTDGDNMPTAFDKQGFDKKIFDNLERQFKAKQQDVWDQTEKKFADYYDRMLDQRTLEGRNNVAQQARYFIDSVKNTGKASADQITKWTNRFTLEDYLDPAGTTTKSQAKAAINKLDPKDAMNFFLNSIKRGDESDLGGPSTVYNSYELFKGKCMDELLKINPDYTYTELEQSCPTVMEYLEYAKKSLPPMMQDVVESAKNMLNACLGDEGAKEEINGVMDIVYDMLFEVNISDFDAAQQKVYKDRIARAINSKYGSKLEKDKNYKWLKDETSISAITNYKQGVFGQEKALAQAMQARENNPDIYYKDMYGNDKFWMGEDVQNGLTLIENAERQMVADAIKYKTGKDIDPAEIPAAYESDGVNDVNARNIYTVDGNDYYFTSKDGKHVTMYEKKTGEKEWHEAKTKEQQEKYDSPRETAKRAIQDIDVSTVPPFKVPASGVMPETQYSQKQWNSMNNIQKKNVIMSLLSKYPDEMQQWLDEQPDKKKK